ncbi:MAG: hypothetical protein C0467_19160 [Planctomycetaceae bacterium]|nr:hypothetical protein [Planctomycetaceae bacterium]
MAVVIYDPELEREVRAARDKKLPNNRDEVWDGVRIMAPMPNNEHQRLVTALAYAFASVVNLAVNSILPGCNVSDRDKNWLQNYREPDVAVYLSTTTAKDCGTHWVGGPDIAVEIVSPGEDPRQKLDFYATVNTREVLIVDRDPWAVELYQLQSGKLVLVGASDATTSAVLASAALPLMFQMQLGTPRPTIHISHTTSQQTWTA